MQASPPELAQKVAALCCPETYPEPPPRVEVVETHMSFVFLTPTHAYKLKKPVRYDFLDFSTLELRGRNCHEELRLNRRLAPGVYLGVVPLTTTASGRLRLGATGEVVEWVVQMRRLPREHMLDERIRRSNVAEHEIDTLGETLAAFYRRAPAEPITIERLSDNLRREIERDHEVLAAHAETDAGAADALRSSHHHFLVQDRPLLQERIARRRIVEGHGDLRPEHVCLLPAPVVFDCIEFNRGLRIVDPVGELAFLAMECERLGASWIGPYLLQRYAAATGDIVLQPLTDFYKSRSASLRARLCLLHTRELEQSAWSRWTTAAADYLAIARRYAD
jgi:aminoglycoside phosphotransferase family enzyme